MTPAERAKAWRAANPDKVRANRKRWKDAHPEYVRRERREYMRVWRAANYDRARETERRAAAKKKAVNPTYHRDCALRRLYGITPADYDRMLAKQGGVCAICGSVSPRLHVDHCHATGGVRGLLCVACNLSLGKMKDSPALLRAAADYIERHQQGA